MSYSTSIAVDGSNLAGLPNGQGFDGRRLRAAVEQLTADFGDRARLIVFVDASLRHQVTDDVKTWLDSETARGVVKPAPAGVNADPFILEWTNSNNAIVISNDMFKEFEDRYPWIKTQGSGRCVAAMFDDVSHLWTFMERRPGHRAARLLTELLPPKQPEIAQEPPKPFAQPSPNNANNTASSSPRPTTKGRHYSSQITRGAPVSLVFLLDQSGSMTLEWRNGVSKAVRLAAILNDTIRELVITATRMDGVRPYFHLAVLGYSGGAVTSLLKGSTLEHPFRSITEIHESSVEVEEIIDGRRLRKPVYLEMKAQGGTPMCEGFRIAEKILRPQITKFPTSFPPIVINITDGEPTDGDPELLSRRLMELSTTDGAVLVFNAHIAKDSSTGLRCPSSLPSTAPAHADLLFRMSSPVPDALREKGAAVGFDIPAGGRGVLVNASPDEVVMLLNVGTLPTKFHHEGP